MAAEADADNGAPETGSNFYMGFLLLPKRKREALRAVYGFCRHVDDIVDSGEHSRGEAERRLEFWRAEIERLFEGGPTHEVSRRVLPFLEEFRLPKEGFLELVRGVAMDLERSRYETFADLEKYLFGVAGAVGLLCVEIFGYRETPPSEIREYAVAMGNAFQLTNIMRDVGADLERGRIYLPLRDMREAGYSAEAFVRREHTPAFRALMNLEYKRAKSFYRKARNLLRPADRPAMLSAEVMAHIYEALLEEMKRQDYRVFFRRVRLPLWRKVALAAKAWAATRGIY
ncbi:MAG: presqualene diphosphate synthase HpnD [Elusimicrobiota bacterium]